MGEGRLSLSVLGPFQLLIDGAPVTVARAKTRATLTVLALYGNEPVAVEHLVDVLWDVSPPASAQANLRNYLTEVHRLLPPHADGRPRLVRTSGSATLRVDPGELDLLRFDAALTAARDLGAHGEPAQAAAAYRRALLCWRGAAVQGMPRAGRLRDKLDMLDAARLDAYDEHVELSLALGEGTGLLTELRETLARHPFRERTCANLMTALYRAGQPAAALELYRRTERTLREELGITPTPRLQQLQLAVLHHDPKLEAGTAPPAARGPWQAPPVPNPFVGRPGEFAAAVAALRRRPGVGTSRAVVLHGLAGAGKSALASAIAHRCRDDYPDGCLYANLNGADSRLAPTAPREVIARFLRTLSGPGPVPADLDEAAAALRSRLTGHRVLLLLDNAASAEQVRPLLPADDSCAVIVTARGSLSTLDAVHVVVGKLPQDDAAALMRHLVGTDRVALEQDALHRIVAACGQLPLALRIAGSRLISRPDWPLGQLADRLESQYRRLDELHADDLDVRSSFAVSYDALLEEGGRAATAVELFRLLGLLDADDVVAATATALLGGDEADAEQAVERLCRDHLVEPAGAGRYRFHDLLRIFAREQGTQRVPAEDWTTVLRRLLLWYGAVTEAANRLLQPWLAAFASSTAPAVYPRPPFADRDGARRWLDAERHNIVLVLRQGAAGPVPARQAALPLALELGRYLNTWGHWIDLRATGELALRLGEELGDKAARAKVYGHLGNGHLRNNAAAAGAECFARALALHREIGDTHGASRMLNNLALCHRRIGDYATSVDYLHEVLEVRRDLGDDRGEATALDNLGLVYQSMGRYDEAVAAHEQGRGIVQRLGDSLLEALILLNLGETVRLAGRLEEAADLLREAGKLARAAGNGAAEAEALDGLVKVLTAQGLDGDAEECRRQAAGIRRALTESST